MENNIYLKAAEVLVKDEEDISEEYDLSKLDEHTLGILEAIKAFI